MNDQTERKHPEISRVHSRAICNEVGERLRSTPMARRLPMSPRLLRLVGELDSLDDGDTPSGSN
jgi:hypothetical protein